MVDVERIGMKKGCGRQTDVKHGSQKSGAPKYLGRD